MIQTRSPLQPAHKKAAHTIGPLGIGSYQPIIKIEVKACFPFCNSRLVLGSHLLRQESIRKASASLNCNLFGGVNVQKIISIYMSSPPNYLGDWSPLIGLTIWCFIHSFSIMPSKPYLLSSMWSSHTTPQTDPPSIEASMAALVENVTKHITSSATNIDTLYTNHIPRLAGYHHETTHCTICTYQ